MLDTLDRTFETGDVLDLPMAVSHFSPLAQTRISLRWRLDVYPGPALGARPVLAGHVPGLRIRPFDLTLLGNVIQGRVPTVPRNQAMILSAELCDAQQRVIATNHWDIWFFKKPAPAVWRRYRAADEEIPLSVRQRLSNHGPYLLATRLQGGAVAQAVKNGGRVLLVGPRILGRWMAHPVLYKNGWWTDPDVGHYVEAPEALAGYPLRNRILNLDLIRPIEDGGRMVLLESMFLRSRIIVRVIRNDLKPMATVFELNYGKARILATSLNLLAHAERVPAARHFLQTLMAYLARPIHEDPRSS